MQATRFRLLSRLLVLSLAFALPGCASNPAPADLADASADAPEMKLVTLNLWHDKGDWPKRKALIVAGLRELDPDVIALQEVLQHEGLPNQAKTIADALGYRYVFSSLDDPAKPKRYGNAILTRHPILAHEQHALEPLDDFRNILLVRIDFHGRPLNVYDTHLHWTPEGGAIRATQVADALAWIERTRGDAPTILAGDLNADMGKPELQPLLTPFLDAYAAVHPDVKPGDPAHTTLNLTLFDEPRHIDQVLLQRGAFEPLAARVILDTPDAEGTWPSDHHGVLARFRLEAPSHP